MKGLEISRAYWEECAKPVFEEKFPSFMPFVAAGLMGPGSECFGFDDEISRDHDFEAGFCLWLPDENTLDRRTEFLMERAYYSLPAEFMGLKRPKFSPAGGNRHGVFRTAEYFKNMSGIPGEPSGWRDFIRLPDSALSELTNGAVFYDPYGEVSRIRKAWAEPPEDYVLKKLSGALFSMSQTGEYNYGRILSRGERGAAVLCAAEYVKSALSAIFWLNSKPVPYYKWAFRALRDYDGGSCGDICAGLEGILLPSDREVSMEDMNAAVLDRVRAKYSSAHEAAKFTDLQHTSFALNDMIKDPELRNMSILLTAD